ncbi:MAG: TPM domain-containing protein [Minwuia sp.]|nr:TPM domain-containing protein [Minwuia sp.]
MQSLRRTAALPVLLALVLWAGLAAAQTFPPLTGRVVDQAGVLDAATVQQLTAALAAHEKASSNQVVVVTLQSLEGYEIADYGYRLGRAWGIGQEGRNNGALLIVAPTERKVRIEVGYGLEGSLTDATSRLIIENEILPAFRDGRMSDGIVRGTHAILDAIAGTYTPLVEEDDEEISPILILVGFLMLVVFMSLRDEAHLGPYRTRHNGRRLGGGYGSGGFGGSGGGGGGFSGGGGGFGGGGSSGGW